MSTVEKAAVDLSVVKKYIASALRHELNVPKEISLACAETLLTRHFPDLLEVLIQADELPQEIIEMCTLLLKTIEKYKQ